MKKQNLKLVMKMRNHYINQGSKETKQSKANKKVFQNYQSVQGKLLCL